MKKVLLFVSIALLGLGVQAQVNVYAPVSQAPKAKVKFDQNQAQTITTQGVIGSVTKSTKDSEVIAIGKAGNLYTTILDEPNQVAYNPALNTITFVHRNDPATTGTGTSGEIYFDISTDGGATWTSNLGPLTPDPSSQGVSGNRYPSIALYNPAGNTDASNGFVLAAGPSLLTASTYNWGGLFAASSKFDGTSNVACTYEQTTMLDFHPYGLTATTDGGKLFSMSTLYNEAASGYDTIKYLAFKINEYNFNATNNNFDWTINSVLEPDYLRVTFDNNITQIATGWNMAFDPTGQIGYAVITGVENYVTTSALDSVPRPIIWKTTDGGTTWNKLSINFDMRTLPGIENLVRATAGQGLIRPFLSSFDAVVDKNGALHMFTNVASGFTAYPDSLYYTFVTAPTNNSLWDLITTDGQSWQYNLIDTIDVLDGEYDATNSIDISVRPQATRTADGTKLFYTWTNTDTLMDSYNLYPDLWACGYDVDSACYTEARNMVLEIPAAQYDCFYATIPNVCITNGSEHQYEIPTVIAALQGSASATVPVQFKYIKGAGFDNADFPCLASSVGENTIKEGTINVYPNPSSNMVNVMYTINTNDDVNITVTNLLGQRILNIVDNNNFVGTHYQTIDLSSVESGIYFVTFEAGSSSYTKKLVVK